MDVLFCLRLGAQTFATLLGSLAVFAVWKSFYAPESAIYVLLFLPVAAGIVFALDERPKQSRRR